MISPTDFTISAKPLAILKSEIDWRSYFLDKTKAPPLRRPYASVAEALDHLNSSNPIVVKQLRTGNFPVYIHSGSLQGDGSFQGGEVNEYWFRNGIADYDLVRKTNTGASIPVVRAAPITNGIAQIPSNSLVFHVLLEKETYVQYGIYEDEEQEDLIISGTIGTYQDGEETIGFTKGAGMLSQYYSSGASLRFVNTQTMGLLNGEGLTGYVFYVDLAAATG